MTLNKVVYASTAEYDIPEIISLWNNVTGKKHTLTPRREEAIRKAIYKHGLTALCDAIYGLGLSSDSTSLDISTVCKNKEILVSLGDTYRAFQDSPSAPPPLFGSVLSSLDVATESSWGDL